MTPTDNFVSAAFCISAPFESVFSQESIGAPYALVQHGDPLRHSYSVRRRVFCICVREPCRVAARTRIAIEDAKPFCSRAWKGDAGLVLGWYPVSRYPDLALLAHAWARNPAYSGCDLASYFGGIDLCLGSTRQSRGGRCSRLAADTSDLGPQTSSAHSRSRNRSCPAHIRSSPLTDARSRSAPGCTKSDALIRLRE